MLVLVPTLYEAVRLFGPSIERDLLARRFSYQVVAGLRLEVSLCGFGMASSGSGAAVAITRYLGRNHQVLPSRIILMGIGGSFDPDQAPIGSALYGTHVSCDGIGLGTGKNFQSASELGFPQGTPSNEQLQVGDDMELALPFSSFALSRINSGIRKGPILSVCAASANDVEAKQRKERFEDVLIEDMETFSVGLAAQLYKTPLTVIRGISNVVGVQEKSQWKIGAAIQAAIDLLPTAVNQIQVENL